MSQLGSIRNQGQYPWMVRLLSVGVFLALWYQLNSAFGSFLIAPPDEVVLTWINLVIDGTMITALIETSKIIFAGLGLAILLGVPFGLLMINRHFDWSLNPFVTVFYILPPAGLVPVFIIWFGIGWTSKILLTFIFAVLPIIINIRAGVKETQQTHLDVSRSFGASRYETYREVIFPSVTAYFVTGLRHATARAIIGAIVAEIFLSTVGLGELIIQSTSLYNIALNFATLITLVILSLSLTEGLRYLETRLFPWREESVT